MEELDLVGWGSVDDRLVNSSIHGDRAHRDGTIGDGFGNRQEVGPHAEALGCEGLAGPAKAADHFLDDEQDAVRRSDCAQTFQIALRLSLIRI